MVCVVKSDLEIWRIWGLGGMHGAGLVELTCVESQRQTYKYRESSAGVFVSLSQILCSVIHQSSLW